MGITIYPNLVNPPEFSHSVYRHFQQEFNLIKPIETDEELLIKQFDNLNVGINYDNYSIKKIERLFGSINDFSFIIKPVVEFSNDSFAKIEPFFDNDSFTITKILKQLDENIDTNNLKMSFECQLLLVLISHGIREILLIFKNKLADNQEFKFPIYKLNNYDIWSNKNDLLPNGLKDFIKLPFNLDNFQLLNSNYIYNCLLHYICFPEEIIYDEKFQFNLIWLDKISKLHLNKLIYLKVFQVINTGFSPIENYQNFNNIEIGNSNNFFALQIKNIPELELFCCFYDLSINDFVSRKFPMMEFQQCLNILNLKLIERNNYENEFCLSYLKYLRYKDFCFNNSSINKNFEYLVKSYNKKYEINIKPFGELFNYQLKKENYWNEKVIKTINNFIWFDYFVFLD